MSPANTITLPFPSVLRWAAQTRQHGAAMLEFALVALPILFLSMGSIELAHWMYTRQAISLALMEAGRAAITGHVQADRMINSFEAALQPLYATATSDATLAVARALAKRQHDLSAAPWQIEVLSPSANAYSDFGDARLQITAASGRPAINNDYLAEQSERHQRLGWPGGTGPVSGQTIYEANTLVLRLSWPHQPLLPWLAPLLRPLGNPHGRHRERSFAQGYLPMLRQITLVMQSHPVHWPNHPSGKVLFHPESKPSSACRGWLCWEDTSALNTPSPGVSNDKGALGSIAQHDHAANTPDSSHVPPNTSPKTPSDAVSEDTGVSTAYAGDAHPSAQHPSKHLGFNDQEPWGGSGASDEALGPERPEPDTDPAQNQDTSSPGPPNTSTPPPSYGDVAVDPSDPACGVTLCCV